jgi:TolB-like protein/Flp pilus assembly protein TadD
MGKLLQELKRRNVFRVSVAYIVVAWLIIQVIETVSDPLGLPDWTEAFFIVLLLAGLPVIILFSWAFELTPEGLKKTKDVDTAESVTAVTGKKLNHTIIIVLVLALGYFLWERQGLVEQATQPVEAAADSTEEEQTPLASIAVLPFVNMSADPEQEYFSDGISEELLNLLAKIPDLRVPARTSSFQFKGQNLDIGDVARQLNVKHVLEGSVRKADVRVRVTAQLIEADTGYHLWSDTFDRELDDIFAIQDEISAAIVAALSETLGLNVDAAPAVKAAANPEAYNAFLLAQHQIQKRTKQDVEASIPNYQRALAADPNYAPAHAGIGLAWYLLTASGSTYGALSLEESMSRSLPHIEKALELDEELPEALGVMGLILEARQRHEEALPYFEKSLALNPSLTDVRNWYSQTLTALGRSDDALNEMEKAYQADPLSVLTLNNYTNELLLRRRFDKVGPVLDRLAQIDPARGMNFKGYMLVAQRRAADGVEQELRAVDYDPANLRLRSQSSFSLWHLGFKDAALELWPYPDNILPLINQGIDFEYRLELAQKRFNGDPNNQDALEGLAWAHWNVGHNEEALKLAERYLDTLGATRRPIDGTNMMFALDAWQRGDEEAMRERLVGLEARIDQRLASGVDFFWPHFQKAMILQMRGKTSLALEHMEKAVTHTIFSDESLGSFYDRMGFSEMPGFVELRKRNRQYIAAEREQLLAKACGPDGFDVWRPSAAECGKTPSPN